MDQRQQIIDNYDKLKIKPDEQFQFHCRMCGQCCINREDILLNPKDVYKISKELKLTPKEMVNRYCDTYVGSSSRMPIIRLKPQGQNKRCPLLKNNRCLVHKVKPTVCAMFPIGRGMKIKTDDKDNAADEIDFIFINPDCGDKRETHTVREWLSKFGIPLEDEYFIKWQRAIAALTTVIGKLEKLCEKKAMLPIWGITGSLLYVNYNMEQEFMPQFEANSQAAVQSLEQLLIEISRSQTE